MVSLNLAHPVHDGKLHIYSRRRQSSTSAVRQSAEDDHSTLSTGHLWSSVFSCCGQVDLEFSARQTFVTQLWVSAFSGVTWKHVFVKYWWDALSALDFFNENALYKFALYLLTGKTVLTWTLVNILAIYTVSISSNTRNRDWAHCTHGQHLRLIPLLLINYKYT